MLRAWKEWVKVGDENTREMGNLVAKTISSEDFWKDVYNVVMITKPIYILIKFCDDEGAKMGEAYQKLIPC